MCAAPFPTDRGCVVSESTLCGARAWPGLASPRGEVYAPGVPWSASNAPVGEYPFEIVGRPGYCLLVPDSEVLIHATDLTKRFGNFTAVDGIGLRAAPR